MRTLRRNAQRLGAGRSRPLAPSPVATRKPSERFQFIRETISELKKVTWPTRQDTINLTVIVILVSLAVGLFLGTIDWTFTQLLNWLLLGR